MAIRRHHLLGMLLGLAVTAGTATLFLGGLDRLERLALDLRFLYANRFRADPRIVHVDIDDGSIDRIGRWPWHRDVLADLIRSLRELGAGPVVLDLILDTPQPYRADLAGLDPSTGAAQKILGRFSEANLVRPDDELCDAVRRAGNVFLSTFFEIRTPGEGARPTEVLRKAMADEPALSLKGAARLVGAAEPLVRPNWLAERMTRLLEDRFDLGEAELARRLDASAREVAPLLARAKREAASSEAKAVLTSRPTETDEAFVRKRLPEVNPDTTTPDTKDLVSAIQGERARRALLGRCGLLPAAMAGRIPTAANLIAPLPGLTEAAAGVGFVVFHRDADGRVREMPLVAECDGRMVKQLGLAVACRQLDIADEGIRLGDDGWLEITPRQGGHAMRIQLDAGGRMVVPWTATGKSWRTGEDFRHLPASSVLAIAHDRRQIADNEKRISLHMADLIGATKRAAAGAYVEKVERLEKLRREARRDDLAGRDTSPEYERRSKTIEALGRDVAAAQRNAEAMVRATYRETRGVKPESAEETAMFRAYAKAHATLTGQIERLRDANRKLDAKIAAARTELAPLLRDRIVFVGFTATAEGDIVPSPIDANMPGVIAHSNVLNALLTRQFVARPHRSTEIVLILLFGTAVTLLTATRGPILTLAMTLAAMVGYVVLNFAALFAAMSMWVLVVAPAATILIPWAAVTAYRQLTAERQKRFVQSQLAEYSDVELARRIADEPWAAEALQRVENREITCFFSDLAGFTTIAEQLDSGRLQRMLNTYLETMSDALFRHGAFLNKFLGDGIMAFFNPIVNPQPDHARRACEAALDAFEALQQLRESRRGEDPLYDRLAMRIGLASGVAGVGRFGSRRKADYTVIGDCANLAARLEPANKVFGTRLLVSATTRDAVRDLYEWRYLAELQVKGKNLTVPVFELVCRAGELTPEQKEYNLRFETGVELYKQRMWDEAIVQFTRILARRFDDAGASAYINACQEKKLFPPDDSWTGALELKEK